MKAIIVKKALYNDLAVGQQVPKIVAEILALIKLRASDNQLMKETILLKALPKIFNKINVLLRFQNETRCLN